MGQEAVSTGDGDPFKIMTRNRRRSGINRRWWLVQRHDQGMRGVLLFITYHSVSCSDYITVHFLGSTEVGKAMMRDRKRSGIIRRWWLAQRNGQGMRGMLLSITGYSASCSDHITMYFSHTAAVPEICLIKITNVLYKDAHDTTTN